MNWDVLKGQLYMQKQQTTIGWITTPLSMVPWAGPVLQQAVAHLLTSHAEERVRRGRE